MAVIESDYEQFDAALSTLGFRDCLSNDVLKQLLEKFNKVSFEKGDSVLLQGRSGGAFFILITGTVSIWAEKDEGEKVRVTQIDPVTYFGEIALLERAERIATLIAEEHVEVFTLGKKDFFELLYSNPQIKLKIELKARERKKDTGSKTHTGDQPEFVPEVRKIERLEIEKRVEKVSPVPVKKRIQDTSRSIELTDLFKKEVTEEASTVNEAEEAAEGETDTSAVAEDGEATVSSGSEEPSETDECEEASKQDDLHVRFPGDET